MQRDSPRKRYREGKRNTKKRNNVCGLSNAYFLDASSAVSNFSV